MQLPTEQGSSHEDVAVVALDWASLGGLVRRETFDAVTMHFATVATDDADSPADDRLPVDLGRVGER